MSALIASCLLLSLQSQRVAICLLQSLMDVGSFSQSLRSHGVAACLSLSPMVSGCLSLSHWSHGVAACLSLSPVVSGCLSLSLLVPWICCMFLTVSYG